MIPSQSLKNNFYFKKILNYCSRSIRSNYEVKQKLDDFENIEETLKKEILDYFIKIKVVYSDEDYLNYYLENLSSSKGFTYNQLYLKLVKKIENKSILKQTLNEYFKETGDIQIQRFIERNLRKIARKEPGNKRISFLLQKGFKMDNIAKYLPKYNL